MFEFIFKNYNLKINETGILGGEFGGIKILPSPFFTATVRNLKNGTDTEISSENLRILSFEKGNISLKSDLGLTFYINIEEKNGLLWHIKAENESKTYSIMSLSYPMPRFSAPKFSLFEPGTCGKVTKISENTYENKCTYPATSCCMQYFAAYDEKGGIYMGIEDSSGALKRISITANNTLSHINVLFPAIGATNAGNSFELPGKVRWQYFEGDWFDAAMLYKNFTENCHGFLPTFGRPDTPLKYKETPFWICDYIPNSEYQRDNKPMSISAGSDIYEKDYWYKAALKLKEELKTPVAYHVYNWHHIPFNVEYPHFLPAKAEFTENIKKLKDGGIYIMPYINAVSWDTEDIEGGHKVNFKNCGKDGAVSDENGEVVAIDYPQTTASGKEIKLAPMCPTFEKWHEIVEENVRKIENTFDIDGIYFDEIAAHPPKPCYNKTHSHAPGGGSFWAENYNKMMTKINENRPENSFYFTESNADAYIKSFDGYLTWMWVQNGEVPAFPAVYAGYTQMVGRCTLGKKKDDFEFFKYCTAKSLLYGQQIGWYKADVIYKPKWLDFLKKFVQTRYKYKEYFLNSFMLRPPKIETDLEVLKTSPAMHYTEEMHMPQLLSAAWQTKSGKKAVFLVNTAEEEGTYKIYFDKTNFREGIISPHEIKVWEM